MNNTARNKKIPASGTATAFAIFIFDYIFANK
jgi:hypothetical protein